MTFGDANDPMLRALRRLPAAAPDEPREARVRARCHAALERARRVANPPLADRPRSRSSKPRSSGASACVYLSAVLHEVARLIVVR